MTVIFAYHVELRHLGVFENSAEALKRCLTYPTRLQDWLFFAFDGSPLRVQDGGDGVIFLRPWASCASCQLAQILPYVDCVQGNPPFDSVRGIRDRLGL
jgi:hypothetical protein